VFKEELNWILVLQSDFLVEGICGVEGFEGSDIQTVLQLKKKIKK
jgi:hypothetical protein